jgi:hypothetical protein
MASIPAYATGFAVFDRQQLSAESFDAGRAEARDELAVVFFRGLECLNCGLNCEIARKTKPVQPDTIRALSFVGFAATSMNTGNRTSAPCFTAHPRDSSSTAASVSPRQPAGTTSGGSRRLRCREGEDSGRQRESGYVRR